MECVEAADLKSSFFGPEMMVMKKAEQVFDEEWTAGNGADEEEFVDDFLDFSNEDVEGFVRGEVEEEEEKDFCGSLRGDGVENGDDQSNSSVSVKEEFASELGVPTDDLADLEWLSHFVEDSFMEFPSSSHPLPHHHQQTKTENKESENRPRPCTQIPAKARRSKRSRSGGRVWSFRGAALNDSSSPSSSSASSSSSSSCLIFTKTGQNPDLFYHLGKPLSKKPKPSKKQSKLPVSQSETGQRRCTHCFVQKTPQWRTGPLGSKTLCNACGVRYKSGRLLPEYRPAGSPTFLSEVHSNNHRKVLEMRRKKELVPLLETGLIPV